MGTTIKCSCCSQEENKNEIRYGSNELGYGFKIMASFNLINLFDLFT